MNFYCISSFLLNWKYESRNSFLLRRPKTPSHAQPKGTRLPNPEWNRDMAPNTVKAPQGDLLITSVKQNNELQVIFQFLVNFFFKTSF